MSQIKYILFKQLSSVQRTNEIHTCQILRNKKVTVEIFSEVEKLLDSGSIKHRKHPGVKKNLPISLPPKLIYSAQQAISKEKGKNLKEVAEDMLNVLSSRRLPLEKDEITQHIQKRYPIDESNIGVLPEVLTKQELAKLKKEILRQEGRWKSLAYDRYESLGYLVARLAPNYASTFKIFSQIKSELPEFNPETVFDFGSGIGSVIWAAKNTWEESIKEYFCVDASPDMHDLLEQLLTDEVTGELMLKNTHFRQFLPSSESVKYDLVVSAFSLLELPSQEERLKAVDILWRKTKDILVIIEFGNFAGFFSVLDARDYILQTQNISSEASTGAQILMPCPHQQICPMLESGTKRACGTSVNYHALFERSDSVVKKDWISYVVLRKGAKQNDAVRWPRIVMPVLKKSGHVFCRMCCSDGKLNEVVVTRSKHGRHAYRCARSSTVGDHLPVTIRECDIVKSGPRENE